MSIMLHASVLHSACQALNLYLTSVWSRALCSAVVPFAAGTFQHSRQSGRCCIVLTSMLEAALRVSTPGRKVFFLKSRLSESVLISDINDDRERCRPAWQT